MTTVIAASWVRLADLEAASCLTAVIVVQASWAALVRTYMCICCSYKLCAWQDPAVCPSTTHNISSVPAWTYCPPCVCL